MREENEIIWIEYYNQVQKPRNSLSDWLTFGHELIFDPHVNWNKNIVCWCHDTQNEAPEEHKWIYGLSYILYYNYWNLVVTILQLLLLKEDCLCHDFRSALKLIWISKLIFFRYLFVSWLQISPENCFNISACGGGNRRKETMALKP